VCFIAIYYSLRGSARRDFASGLTQEDFVGAQQ